MLHDLLLSLLCVSLLLFVQLSFVRSSENATPNDISMLWGPYRPNLYFGLRARTSDSPLMGLMWAQMNGDDVQEGSLRHTCEQTDGMVGYGWEEYDPRRGGIQKVHDIGNSMDVTMEFLRSSDAGQGNYWRARVKSELRADAGQIQKSMLVFYIGMGDLGEASGAMLNCAPNRDDGLRCVGSSTQIGSFQLDIVSSSDASFQSQGVNVTMWSVSEPDDSLWQAKRVLLDNRSTRRGQMDASDNLYFVELTSEDDIELEISYSHGGVQEPQTSLDIDNEIKLFSSFYSSHFDRIYKPQPPFESDDYTPFSKALLSNLLGGIGYFHGDSKVDFSKNSAYEEDARDFWKAGEDARQQQAAAIVPSDPTELFTMVPSRPFFPRGFLWDEGFHLLLLLDWDLDLALEILSGWFALMDENGWIAREQILGPEARSKVPPEFQVQYPDYANPPTLFMVIDAFCNIVASDGSNYHGHLSEHAGSSIEFLTIIYPLMKRHFEWFRRTQAGNMTYSRPAPAVQGYRWRGRTPQHTLTSGLDDYPRAEPPHPGELHVDALSWVGLMAGVLAKVGNLLGKDEEQAAYLRARAKVMQSLSALHWSAEHSAFCDATANEEGLRQLVCHKGYLSLFPFVLDLMQADDRRIGAVLDFLTDPDQLWTPYGIRSLNKAGSYYGTGENYWRGPIWININYLVLKQLLNLASTPGAYQEETRGIYSSLRRNVVNTVYNSWVKTGFAWEQYNPDNGVGQRTQHFTGWTALVVKIMAMPDVEAAEPSTKIHLPTSSRQGNEIWLVLAVLLILAFYLRRKPFGARSLRYG